MGVSRLAGNKGDIFILFLCFLFETLNRNMGVKLIGGTESRFSRDLFL